LFAGYRNQTEELYEQSPKARVGGHSARESDIRKGSSGSLKSEFGDFAFFRAVYDTQLTYSLERFDRAISEKKFLTVADMSLMLPVPISAKPFPQRLHQRSHIRRQCQPFRPVRFDLLTEVRSQVNYHLDRVS
jgi:hypothetical protein